MSNVHLLACLCCNLHNWNQSLSYNECRWFFWKINVVNKINFLYNNNWFVVIYYDLSRHMSSILQLRSSRESSRLAYSFSAVKGSQPQLRPLVTCSELICWEISNYNVSKYCKLCYPNLLLQGHYSCLYPAKLCHQSVHDCHLQTVQRQINFKRWKRPTLTCSPPLPPWRWWGSSRACCRPPDCAVWWRGPPAPPASWWPRTSGHSELPTSSPGVQSDSLW